VSRHFLIGEDRYEMLQKLGIMLLHVLVFSVEAVAASAGGDSPAGGVVVGISAVG
jgi:hypothetical protein